MARKYDREQDGLERLEKENRELKSLNRSLVKRITKLSRGYYKYLDREEDAKEEALEQVTKEVKKVCFSCGIGELKKVDLGNRYYRQCTNCPKKTRSKPIES